MIMNRGLFAGAVLAPLLIMWGCSEPTDPDMAFLERAARTPFESFEFGEGSEMRRNGSYYQMAGDPFRFDDAMTGAIPELEEEMKAFARGGGNLHEARFVKSCTYRHIQRRERLYLIPVDEVRPGATERIAQRYDAAAAAYVREKMAQDRDETPQAAAWPPTHGPYVMVVLTTPRAETDQPLTECLRAFFPHASLSPEIQAAALQRAQRIERQTWERLEDLRLRTGAGRQRARMASSFHMVRPPVVFYSAKGGWRETRLSIDRETLSVGAETLNDAGLGTCGFSGDAGGAASLFAQACMNRLGIAGDFDWRSLSLHNAFGLDDILAGYQLDTGERIEIQIRGED